MEHAGEHRLFLCTIKFLLAIENSLAEKEGRTIQHHSDCNDYMPYPDSWQSLTPTESPVLGTVVEIIVSIHTMRVQQLSYCWPAARLCEAIGNAA
jgi:hypothetical protein